MAAARKCIGYRPRTFLASLLLALALGAVPAQAQIQIESFGFSSTNADGSASVQAGGHPADVTTSFKFVSHENEKGELLPDESARDLRVDLPPGLIGNPTAVPTCTEEALSGEAGACSPSTQVGYISLNAPASGLPPFTFPIFNMKTPPGVSAQFGFYAIIVPVHMTAKVRSGGDYGISITLEDLPQSLPWTESKVVFWGVPADHSHDEYRGSCLGLFGPSGESCPSQAPRTALLTNPSTCSPSLTAFTQVDSWEDTGSFASASASNEEGGKPVGIEGCEGLRFRPSLEVTPEARSPHTPSGLSVRLRVAQNDNPDGAAEATLNRAVVKLPAGVSLSPPSADGLGACALDQIHLYDEQEPACPESSKIGTVQIDTPLLADPLEGSIYLAQERSNPFGSKFAIYLAASGSGTLIKLVGRVEADPATGQLTTTFEENPQLPFDELQLNFKGGPRAALSTPARCGTYETTGQLTPWGAAPNSFESVSSSFQIDQGCGGQDRFEPNLEAGTVNPAAGSHSPFSLRVTSSDGEQNLAKIETTLPEGVLAKLAGVPVCGEAGAAAGACPPSSQVGRTTIGVGDGSSPIYIPQAGGPPTAVYLAGPYKGAPYSLLVEVPAQAGPFDLGTVLVRNALHVDPETTRVTVKSNPLPQILAGVPIDYRDVRVFVDRPGFTVNPTDCRAQRVTSVLTSNTGAVATPGDRFQVLGCGELGFRPKLSLRFSGPTHRSAHPALKAVLKARKGDANIGKAVVTLPKTEFLENGHIRTVCTRVQYATDNCPKASVYGFAQAWSPLLDKPLRGPVYLRSSNHTLPDLVASLDGQIHVDLAGRIDSVESRIRNTFWAVPDAPVSKFVLKMQGGEKGLLVNNTELCRAKPRARAELTGQNGKRSVSSPLVRVGCGKSTSRR